MTRRLKQQKRFASLCLGSTLLLSGCATFPDPVSERSLDLERVSSQRAKVSYLYVKQQADTFVVRGKVQKRFKYRGPMPGHVHITLIAPTGEVLVESPVSYMQKGATSRSVDFELQLPVEPPVGSTLRATHPPSRHEHTL